MTQISLRAYVEYVEDRLARDALSEVVAQCRHILESYPKYLDVYRLLARTLMDQENNQDALDLFQRVLSADPNDFVSHIGISETYSETGALDQAIWHLERAYEQVPNNIDLQQAIQDLYLERDGEAPRTIHLTSGALARLYMKGELYHQALLELRKGIERSPERLDLQVLLAQALWQSHRHVKAGQVAADLLRRLPNSIDANSILARLWLRAGNLEEAKPFLEKIKALDPYLGYEIEHGGKSPPSDMFQMELLEYTSDIHASEVGAADWVADISSIARERGVSGPSEEPIEPASQITDIFSEEEIAEEPSAPAGEQGGDASEGPDWLQEALASGAGMDDVVSARAAAQEEAPDFDDAFAEGAKTAQAPSSEAGAAVGEPDWLADVLSSDDVVSEEDAPITEAPPSSAAGDETPDWLDEALDDAATTPASSPEPPADAGGEADWMEDVFGDAAEPPIETPSAVEEGQPDWMEDVLGGSAAPPTEAPDEPPPAADDDEPDWLSETLAQDDVSSPEPDAPAAEVDDEPDWLAETMDEQAEAPADMPAAEAAEEPPVTAKLEAMIEDTDRDMPDWLGDILSGEPESAAPARPAQPEVEEEGPGVVSDDWLDGFLTSEADGESEAGVADEQPDWPTQVAEAPDETTPVEEVVFEFSELGELETWDQASQGVAAAAPMPAPDVDETASPATADELEPPAPEPPPVDAKPTLPEDDLDWLREVDEDETLAADEADELPDWLSDAGGSSSQQPASAEPEAAESEDVPDWLADAAPSEEGMGQESSEDDDMPDWLADVGDMGSDSDEGPASDDELPEWLQGDA